MLKKRAFWVRGMLICFVSVLISLASIFISAAHVVPPAYGVVKTCLKCVANQGGWFNCNGGFSEGAQECRTYGDRCDELLACQI